MRQFGEVMMDELALTWFFDAGGTLTEDGATAERVRAAAEELSALGSMAHMLSQNRCR